ncbi:enoyl-CoA hydratase, partial [Mycobacterium sp. ITM-2017-0098]
ATADQGVRTVILGHTGGTFCAGADLSEAPQSGGSASPSDVAVGRARELTRLLRRILELRLPVIAAIDGHVRAGGLGLVGACDIAV